MAIFSLLPRKETSMFWKYLLFETKLLLHNRKNWFLGLILLLFFPVFFIYHSHSEPESLEVQKNNEAGMINSIFDQFPESQQDTPGGEEVYQNLLEQSSLVNYQKYYLWLGDSDEAYIENGLKLNQLRLRVHELGNKGIFEHLVIPKEDILKEDALLRYMQAHDLPLQTDSFVASHYLVVGLQVMSGLLFCCFILISGSDMLVNEQRHRTVVNGIPLAFMKKINSKVSIYFLFIIVFLALGLLLGVVVASRESGIGDFSYPVLFYLNGSFKAISTIRYLSYVFLAMALITIMLLYLSILLNLVFKNAYANILIGIGVLLLPDLLLAMKIKYNFLFPIKYVEFSNVMSGDLATQIGYDQADYWHAIIWLAALSLIMLATIYTKNKITYVRKAKA